MTIYDYFGEWCKVVDLNEARKTLEYLQASKQKICPILKNVFLAFHLCDFDNLRCVIIGKDPYPQLVNNNPVATGIAFANSTETIEKNYSPSLKVLIESIINFSVPHNNITFDPSLKKWEEQGVLLLNSALTCQANKIGSHTLLWRPFIVSLLKSLSSYKTGIIYLLLGEDAQSYRQYINAQVNYILQEKHPSFYARTHTKMPDIWTKINNILIGQNGYGIEWYKEEICE